MSWSLDQILEAVDETDSARVDFVKRLEELEAAWRLEYWTAKDLEKANLEDRKLSTSTEPRNVVQLATTLLSQHPAIVCPAYAGGVEDRMAAEARQQFLDVLIRRQTTTGASLMQSLAWNALVRSRVVLQVAWVQDEYKGTLRNMHPPILYRPLDPMKVGVHRDSLGPQWAFHRYKEKRASANARYPKAMKTIYDRQPPDNKTEVEVIDMWWVDGGDVWNAVLIDRDFAKRSRKSKLPRIPIIEWLNDPTPVDNERWKSLSILDGMLQTWADTNILQSMYMTAVGRNFWPPTNVTNMNGEEIPDLDTGMGAINKLPPGTQFLGPQTPPPNIDLLTGGLNMLDGQRQKSTFPDMMFGEGGPMRTGHGVQLLSTSAARRVDAAQIAISGALREANELALWMVKEFAPSGIEMYGYDETTKSPYRVFLDSSMIGERYDNNVVMTVEIPGAELQTMLAGMQLVDRKIISGNTFRSTWIPMDKRPPRDEEQRVLTEQAMTDPDIMKARLRVAYAGYYGEELPPGEPDMQMTQQVPVPGQHMMPDGSMMEDDDMPLGMAMPNGAPLGGMPPMGPMDMPGIQAMAGSPDEQTMLSMMQGQPIGPQDQFLMLQEALRRR